MKLPLTNQVRFSTNTKWIGKPKKRMEPIIKNDIAQINEDGTPKLMQALYHENKKVYVGYNWVNVACSYQECFDLLTVFGGSICSQLEYPNIDDEQIQKDANSHSNKAQYFKSHSLILVDIDNDKPDNQMTIEDLLKDDFYNDFGSGFYTSPSYTDEQHRFRIIFRLESDITNPDEMVIVYNWLINHYQASDKQCKNATRLFYGTIDAPRKDITERVLTDEMVQVMLNDQRAKKEKEQTLKMLKASNNTYSNELDLAAIKAKLMSGRYYFGSHSDYGKIAASMNATGFTLNDFIDVTPRIANSKNTNDAVQFWNKWSHYKDIGTGTLIHMLSI